MQGKKAVVIGSGVGGLATAVRLARKGFGVTVYEANAYAGGKATKIEKHGFFWGFGPSLFTFPELLDELFTLCGRNPGQYYFYHKLDPICHYFYEDGTRLKSYSEPARFAEEIAIKTGEPASNVLYHLRQIRSLYMATKDIFLFKSLHRLKTYLSLRSFLALFNLPRIGIHRTMHWRNAEHFKDKRIVQLFDRYATYNGSDPYRCPSTLNVIAHPEYNMGAYFLDGGMPQLTESLYRLAVELGVKFRFNARVGAIKVENGSATGVEVDGNCIDADIVVSNMDVVHTYRQLMPGVKAPEDILQQPKSTSAIIFYWGINRSFPELDLHNIFFSSDYKKEFECLAKGEVAEDPTVYVFISSKYQKRHAPVGCENWFTLINVPHNSGQKWDEIVSVARRNIINKLSRQLGVDIEPHIVCETFTSPEVIEQQTLSHLGAIYGSNSNNAMAAFWRHPNFSRNVKNLYFCGGSVHPGGGVPLCLLSAKIVDELVG